MVTKRSAALLCLAMAVSYIQTQYMPFPESSRMDEDPPYLNPSLKDPLFYPRKMKGGYGKHGENDNAYDKAKKYLGHNIYFDYHRYIYVNKETGDYYNPKTGLIYRKSEDGDKHAIDGRVGPSAPSSHDPPYKESDKVYLPRKYHKYAKGYYEDSDDSEECGKCHNYDECYRCQKVVYDRCDECWKGNYHDKCNRCERKKPIYNYKHKGIGYYIIILLNKYRKQSGLHAVGINKRLYPVAITNSMYMAHRGYLNNDNFLANIATYSAGTQTTGYINDGYDLPDEKGAYKFINMWRHSPEHNVNLLDANIKHCAAGIYFDKYEKRYYATLLCVK